MTSYTLLVFEGSSERNVADSLKNHFITNNSNKLVYATFGHNIYQLYSEIKQNPGLDLNEIICEAIVRRNDSNSELLNIEREQISDIFLFFDYDGHTTNANDEVLAEMLELFDDSQDTGKLFVNYPMLEAIRHVQSLNYSSITYPINQLTGYKSFLTQRNQNNELINIQERFLNWGLYSKATWKHLIEINLGRANHLVFENTQLPQQPIEQIELFTNQKTQHIEPYQRISVISAFPLMLHEFYGSNLWQQLSDISDDEF